MHISSLELAYPAVVIQYFCLFHNLLSPLWWNSNMCSESSSNSPREDLTASFKIIVYASVCAAVSPRLSNAYHKRKNPLRCDRREATALIRKYWCMSSPRAHSPQHVPMALVFPVRVNGALVDRQLSGFTPSTNGWPLVSFAELLCPRFRMADRPELYMWDSIEVSL